MKYHLSSILCLVCDFKEFMICIHKLLILCLISQKKNFQFMSNRPYLISFKIHDLIKLKIVSLNVLFDT